MRIENTKVWQTLTEAQRAFWLEKKCKTCFYFRGKVNRQHIFCDNFRKQIGPEDEACGKYRNDIIERERRTKLINPFKRTKGG